MSGLSFASYVRELDSRITLAHLCEDSSSALLGERVYETICQTYISSASVEKRWNELSDDRKNIILHTYLTGDAGWQIPSDETAHDLLKSFLVYEGQILGKRALFGFSDLIEFLVPLFLTIVKTEPIPTPAPILFKSFPADSALLLSMIRHGDIKRRQDGILLKTSIEQFMNQSMIQTICEKINAEQISKILELHLRFFLTESIIRYTVDGYELFHDGEEIWKKSLAGSSERFLELSQSFRTVADLAMVEKLLINGVTFSQEESSKWEIEMALILLAYCGKSVLREGVWSTGNKYEVPSVETGHIMPDFTVLFPREIEPSSLYDFLQVSQIESVDLLCRAKINRELVTDSCARGVTSETLLALFERWHCSPHMMRTIEEWFYSFDRLFVDGNYLAINSRAGDFIAQHPEIESLLTPFQEYRFYRITPDTQAEIRMRLEKMGFDIRMPFAPVPQQRADHPKMLDQRVDSIPLFAPELARKETVQTNFGKYGGALRSQTLVELLKIVRFAILMEEKITVILTNEFEPRTFVPIDVRTGENGAVIGKDSSDKAVEFRLDRIDKIGVVQS